MPKDKALNRSHAITMILSVLKDSARHGYEIAREVERRSSKRITFKDGTLYPLLHGLEKENMISSYWQENPGEKPRRIYEITPAGLAELERQVSLWRDFSNAVESVIQGEQAFSGVRKLASALLGGSVLPQLPERQQAALYESASKLTHSRDAFI